MHSQTWVPRISAVAAILMATGLALGQVPRVARTADNAQVFGNKATDNAISVGEHVIVITSNHGISLFNKSGLQLDQRPFDDPLNPFPFKRVEDDLTGFTIAPSRWFDGRTDYDPTHDRLWMIYSETNEQAGTTLDGDISPLHLAVNKAMLSPNQFDDFSTDDWWYYTGESSPGNGGTAFDLSFQSMKQYTEGSPHNPFPLQGLAGGASSLLDLPIISIDERAVYVTAFGNDANPLGGSLPFQNIFIIPIKFDNNTKSLLDGDKPGENLITSLRLRDLPASDVRYEPDTYRRTYPVQEPHDQVLNAQLFVSVSTESAVEQDAIRLGGLWFDDSDPLPANHRWWYTQHLNPQSLELNDVDAGTGMNFFYGNSGNPIETPATDFDIRPASGFISSAVLTKDNQGNERVFMAHHVYPSVSGVAGTDTVVQWYVIDPHLAKFREEQLTPTWQPTLVASGRLSGSGNYYHPVIGVTDTGMAYLEYTFSDGTTWPQIRRATLTSNYTAIAIGTDILLQAGPTNRTYEDFAPGGSPPDFDDSWADFSDMQADPFLCKLWSTHTLVHDPGGPPPGSIVVGEKRDIWLFDLSYNCFTPDMNGNSVIESGDMLLFNSYYDARDEKADADANGNVDIIDMAIFLDAYTAGEP